ncbi:MAG TPA: glycerate kinase [Chloroflexia bacterium]|nr:glycerate kinase [Chloroflexia bacterium]
MNLLENQLIKPLLAVDEPKLSRRSQALEILGAALGAVEPGAAVRNALRYEPSSQTLTAGERHFDLGHYQRIFVVGAGKAGTPMAQAVLEVLGERVTGGAITVKYGYGPEKGVNLGRLQISEAGHPVLDEAGIVATTRLTGLLKNLTERDLLIAVMSGGGSALLEQPVEGVTLADMQALTGALLRCGATINEMNTVRKHLSQVKGGQLARLAAPATLIGLLLSDVVGSPLDVIASGPTVPDTSTFEDAMLILRERGLLEGEQVPAAILAHLQNGREGKVDETPKPGDPLFERVHNIVVGDNRVAALAALEKARQLGFNSLLLSTFIEGEAREVARMLAAVARETLASEHPLARPACYLAGGETTVTVRGEGLGGRNQEMALAAALAIEGLDNVMIVPLATDGSDGPTDAAGALAEGDTLRLARQQGLDPLDYLRRNDSYHFFEKMAGLLKTGPTNTNVNDLTLVLVW